MRLATDDCVARNAISASVTLRIEEEEEEEKEEEEGEEEEEEEEEEGEEEEEKEAGTHSSCTTLTPKPCTARQTPCTRAMNAGSTVRSKVRCSLAFTRYCHDQYCMVYGIHKGGRRVVRILRNSRVKVAQSREQSGLGGGNKKQKAG